MKTGSMFCLLLSLAIIALLVTEYQVIRFRSMVLSMFLHIRAQNPKKEHKTFSLVVMSPTEQIYENVLQIR